MSKKYNIFIFLIIFRTFIEFTKENDKLKKERIFNTLKLIFDALQLIQKQEYFSLNYLKYKIEFSNLKINNSLILEDKNIHEIIPNYFYIIKNISINFTYNNYIIIDENNDISKFQDLSKTIEMNFNEIEFLQKDNFLYLNKIYISSISVEKIKKVSHLKYFKDYNEGIIKPIYSKTNQYNDIDEIMTNIINNKIYDVFSYINLYYYDLIKILDMIKNRNMTINDRDQYYPYNLQFIFISEIDIPIEYCKIEDSTLRVEYIRFKGYFYFYDGDYLEFNAYLSDDNYMYLNYNIGIYFLNKNQPFTIDMMNENQNYIYLRIFRREFLFIIDEKYKSYYYNLNN